MIIKLECASIELAILFCVIIEAGDKLRGSDIPQNTEPLENRDTTIVTLRAPMMFLSLTIFGALKTTITSFIGSVILEGCHKGCGLG